MLSVDTLFYRSIMLWLCNAYVSMPKSLRWTTTPTDAFFKVPNPNIHMEYKESHCDHILGCVELSCSSGRSTCRSACFSEGSSDGSDAAGVFSVSALRTSTAS
jgi:hypothetical protein